MVASFWFFLWDLYYDARIHEHQVNRSNVQSVDMSVGTQIKLNLLYQNLSYKIWVYGLINLYNIQFLSRFNDKFHQNITSNSQKKRRVKTGTSITEWCIEKKILLLIPKITLLRFAEGAGLVSKLSK
jgi:hypothetical protein